MYLNKIQQNAMHVSSLEISNYSKDWDLNSWCLLIKKKSYFKLSTKKTLKKNSVKITFCYSCLRSLGGVATYGIWNKDENKFTNRLLNSHPSIKDNWEQGKPWIHFDKNCNHEQKLDLHINLSIFQSPTTLPFSM